MGEIHSGVSRDKAEVKNRAVQEKAVRSSGASATLNKQSASAVENSPGAARITQLHKAALHYHSQKKYEQAERMYKDVLALADTPERRDNPELGQVMNNLARLYHSLGNHDEAEPLYRRSLEVAERHYGSFHPKVARRLANLAELHRTMGRTVDAVIDYQRAVEILDKEPGLEHPTSEKTVKAYVSLLREVNRVADAEAIERRLGKAQG